MNNKKNAKLVCQFRIFVFQSFKSFRINIQASAEQVQPSVQESQQLLLPL